MATKYGSIMKFRQTYTPKLFNYALFVLGMVIIWLTSHNWIAMLGGYIASLHFTATHDGDFFAVQLHVLKEDKDN